MNKIPQGYVFLSMSGFDVKPGYSPKSIKHYIENNSPPDMHVLVVDTFDEGFSLFDRYTNVDNDEKQKYRREVLNKEYLGNKIKRYGFFIVLFIKWDKFYVDNEDKINSDLKEYYEFLSRAPFMDLFDYRKKD